MKRTFSCLTVLCLLLTAFPAAEATGLSAFFESAQTTAPDRLGESFERWDATAGPAETPSPETTSAPVPAPEPALFDEGVRDITCKVYGNRVDYAQNGGWIISRGYLMEQERYCLIGQAPDGERSALTDTLPGSFVPAGDAIVYYGKDANGRYNWVILEPGADKPNRLDLGISDEVFYADADFIWYYTHVGAETSIRKLVRESGAREGVARTQGSVVALMESGGILVVDFENNEVKIVKDNKEGKGSTLYMSEEPILSVSSVGKSVWVEHEHEFGLLEDGALAWRLPGHIVSMTGTTDQFVFLLSFPGSDEYDVVIFNDVYKAYARVGYVRASEYAFVELQPDCKMTVWGPEESLIFDIPPEEEWIPYGYYDVESARAASGLSAPLPTVEPDQIDIVTVTIPANLCTLTDEATATAQAEAAGINMTVNRDGSYTYFMTPEQHKEQLSIRAQELQNALEAVLTTEPYSNAIKAYAANEDFSEITFTVDSDHLEDSFAVMAITIIGMVAPTYQALAGNDENPVTVITLIDQATGEVVAVYGGPDDFLTEY